jgi:hypothetical protein
LQFAGKRLPPAPGTTYLILLQVDTCTEELLRDSAAAARERRLPLQIHAAQSVIEFHEVMRRHGRTPMRMPSPGPTSSRPQRHRSARRPAT